jgi:uncharacterized protein DUF6765
MPLPRLCAVLFWLSVTPANAWEADLHYGLTKWLAMQAGFTEGQADWIADGNLGIDSSKTTDPVHTTIASACVGADETGAREVHDHHFPADKSVPNDPDVRAVTPGIVQKGGTHQAAPIITDFSDEARFKELGAFLHSLQDTWSHQGVPDFPQPPCNKRLGWGHAFARGGWACHLADLTYKWRTTDVLPAAQSTYEVLVAQKAGTAKPWSALVQLVDEFATARSKWQKDDWFHNTAKFEDRSFLQEISLPDCVATGPKCPGPYPFERLIDRWKGLVQDSQRPPAGIPPQSIPITYINLFSDIANAMIEGKENAEKNVETWFQDRALAEIAINRAFHVNESCPALYTEWLPHMFGRYFQIGWGVQHPVEVCELAFEVVRAKKNGIPCNDVLMALQDATAKQAAAALPVGPSLSSMAEQARRQDLPLYILTTAVDQTGERYVGFVRFIHLPHDVLVLASRFSSGPPRLTDAAWVPDE